VEPPEKNEFDLKRLVHELQVHQIELELQNEELAQTRDELETVLAEYMDLYEFAPFGYYNLSREGKILQVNLRGTTLLNQNRSSLVGRKFANFLHLDQQTLLNQKIMDSFAGLLGEPTEVLILPSKVHPFFAEFTVNASTDGEECRLVLVDITKRKTAEIALEKLNNDLELLVHQRTDELKTANVSLRMALMAKDEFLSAVSHELRTPLTGILGLSEIMQLNYENNLSGKQLNTLNNIEKNGLRLLEVINNMIDYTMLQSGSISTSVQPCSVDVLCSHAIKQIQPDIELKDQTVEYSTDSPELVLNLDEKHIHQILICLLSNANKFTPVGGHFGIEVVGSIPGDKLRITVWDNGIGIDAIDLKRLFMPFVQVDAKLSRKYEGAGLGLAVVDRLVDLLGGSIFATSEIGKGSRFCIELPREPK
jgi:signal transduction histidine kinase